MRRVSRCPLLTDINSKICWARYISPATPVSVRADLANSCASDGALTAVRIVAGGKRRRPGSLDRYELRSTNGFWKISSTRSSRWCATTR